MICVELTSGNKGVVTTNEECVERERRRWRGESDAEQRMAGFEHCSRGRLSNLGIPLMMLDQARRQRGRRQAHVLIGVTQSGGSVDACWRSLTRWRRRTVNELADRHLGSNRRVARSPCDRRWSTLFAFYLLDATNFLVHLWTATKPLTDVVRPRSSNQIPRTVLLCERRGLARVLDRWQTCWRLTTTKLVFAQNVVNSKRVSRYRDRKQLRSRRRRRWLHWNVDVLAWWKLGLPVCRHSWSLAVVFRRRSSCHTMPLMLLMCPKCGWQVSELAELMCRL